MIPGYTPTSIDIQNHIHLGLVPRDGSGPTGFGAHGEPPYKFQHVEKHYPVLNAQADFIRAWDGTPHDHVLSDTSGIPIVFEDIRMNLRITSVDVETLRRMLKARVYFVDIFHCADTIDHTPYVKIMWLSDAQPGDPVDQMKNFINCDIYLTDMNTVAGL